MTAWGRADAAAGVLLIATIAFAVALVSWALLSSIELVARTWRNRG